MRIAAAHPPQSLNPNLEIRRRGTSDRLSSAARQSLRDPWLCVPSSRRVCPFGLLGSLVNDLHSDCATYKDRLDIVAGDLQRMGTRFR